MPKNENIFFSVCQKIQAFTNCLVWISMTIFNKILALMLFNDNYFCIYFKLNKVLLNILQNTEYIYIMINVLSS